MLMGALAVTACDPEDIKDILDGHGGGGGTPTNPCAVTLCLEGTHCEVQPVACIKAPCPQQAVCVKNPPPVCGPVCEIYCEHGNVLDEKGCPTCTCNEPPVDPCATVRCAAGTHCQATPVQCIKAPCPPVAACVPDAPGVTCGGIAGILCPGAGQCVDNPTDDCDPANGGADCGGLCQCKQTALCVKGFVFDSSPKVCACVAVSPPPPTCGPVCTIYCQFGNVLDGNGCPTCQCKPASAAPPCPPEKCTGPAPKSANYVCPDKKTTAGPACVVTAAGVCEWALLSCPA